MNFYISISQLIQAAEGLEKNLSLLAERAFRVCPRDARANRDLLGQCAEQVGAARETLGKKVLLSKTALRHAAMLSQIFGLCFRRMVLLGSTVAGIEKEDGEYAQTVLYLFSGAHRHFVLFQETLAKLTCVPLALEFQPPADQTESAMGVFQREESYRREMLGLLEKALELFNEERELYDSFQSIRQDLLEAKRKTRRLLIVQAAPKAVPPSPVLARS